MVTIITKQQLQPQNLKSLTLNALLYAVQYRQFILKSLSPQEELQPLWLPALDLQEQCRVIKEKLQVSASYRERIRMEGITHMHFSVL